MASEITEHAGGTELAHSEAPGISPGQTLQLLQQALTNPDVQPEKAVAMFELVTRMEDREAKRRFIAAKVAAISEMPKMGKDGQNTHTKTRYAKWETMQPIVTSVLARHGLVLNFDIGNDGPRVSVAPILSGHGWEERGGAIVLPSDVGKGRNDVQAVASSVSYGKRTAAKAILNIVESGVGHVIEDDDGNAAGGTPMEHTLTAEQQALVNAGREATIDGSAAYAEWFKSRSAAEKGWLAYEPYHEQNKRAAEARDGDTAGGD